MRFYALCTSFAIVCFLKRYHSLASMTDVPHGFISNIQMMHARRDGQMVPIANTSSQGTHSRSVIYLSVCAFV